MTLAESVRGIAPGQTLVLYRGNRVLAQSIIDGTQRLDRPAVAAG